MSKKVMITTTDNPYDPNTQFDQWLSYDLQKGYNTCSYLSRIAKTSEGLSDADNDAEIERAINEIISLDLSGKYMKKVYEI